MSKIYTSADQLIGHTPLLELTHIEKDADLSAKLLAKLEYFNPAGSVKDRIAKAMIDDAEATGKLQARLRHHRAHLRQHRHRSGCRGSCQGLPHHHRHARDHERRAPPADEGLRRRAGAQRGRQGHEGRHRQGRRAGQRDPQLLHPRPVRQPGQPQGSLSPPPAPRSGTTPTARSTSLWPASAPAAPSPAWASTSRARIPASRSWPLSPLTSPVLSKGTAGAHKIQGIGAGFVPDVLDTKVYDEIIAVEQ